MEFEWDDNKRHSNLLKHGLDLVDASALFDGRPIYTRLSARFEEQRFVTVAILDDVLVALVWTERGPVTRLISPRRARDAEEREYRALFG